MFDQLRGRRRQEKWRPGDELPADSGLPVRPAFRGRSDRPPHLEAWRIGRTAPRTGSTAPSGPTGKKLPVRPPEAEPDTHVKPVRPPSTAVRPVLNPNVQRGTFLVLSGISAGFPLAVRPPLQRRSDRIQRSDRNFNAGRTGRRLGRAPLPPGRPPL